MTFIVLYHFTGLKLKMVSAGMVSETEWQLFFPWQDRFQVSAAGLAV
jgi:hypothetical protein